MKERKIKKEKGITLIALIITIIIMLILVAVSINILIKSDLFGTAQRAGDKTKTAYNKEGTMGEITVGNKTYSSIDEYLNERQKQEHNWFYVDETTREQIRCECAECKAYDDGDSAGRTLSIGQQIYYEGTIEKKIKELGEAYTEGETVLATTSISAEKSGIADAKKNNVSGIENYGTLQTINITKAPEWIVFGYEDKDSNGTNETLLITTKAVTSDFIAFYGVTGYNACGEGEDNEIDRMCRELYGEDARGIKIDDIYRGIGYTAPEQIKLSEHEKWDEIKANTDSNGKLYTPNYPNGVVVEENSNIIEELGEYTVSKTIWAIRRYSPEGSTFRGILCFASPVR